MLVNKPSVFEPLKIYCNCHIRDDWLTLLIEFSYFTVLFILITYTPFCALNIFVSGAPDKVGL